jgi:hypothetical protein
MAAEFTALFKVTCIFLKNLKQVPLEGEGENQDN